MPRPARSFLLLLSAFLFLLAGLACVAGGGWLAALGGSWYYVLAGIALVAVAVLLWRGEGSALWLFALLFLLTLVWALWESGLDWWPLAARLDVLFILGLLLLLPGVRRRVAGGGGGAVALSLLLFAVVAVSTWVRDPHTLAGTLPAAAAAPADDGVPAGDWLAYGRTGAGQRYSPLNAITPANVDKLQVAWSFHTGDERGRPGDPQETTFETTPLKIGNRLFFCTPHQSVIALDATTGQQVWRYDPQVRGQLALQHLTCRGLGYQPAAAAAAVPASAAAAAAGMPLAGASAPAVAASSAIGGGPAVAGLPQAGASAPAAPVATTAAVVPPASGPRDASCAAKLFMPTADGRLIALNPDTGHVCAGFGGGTGQIDLWAGMPNVLPGSYYSTSPPVVTQKLVIVGGTVLDNVSTKEQSGVIRAYDVESGTLVWNWDSGRPNDTAPLPPGQAYTVNSPNSWSISAVDEKLGMVYVPLGNQPPDQWGGQRSPDVERYSSSVVALDLASGAVRWVYQTVHHDLWDYDVPAQPSLVDLQMGGGTVPALVQPTKQGELFVLDRRTGKPLLPATEQAAPQGAAQGDHTAATQPKSALSFDPKPLTGADMWGATMFDQLWCRVAFHRLRYEGRFTPPSLQGSLVYPGNFGVFNWGGVAVDPARGAVFATPDTLAFVSQLVPRPDATTQVVQDQPVQGALPALNENFGAPFAVRLHAFISPLGIPCQQPPWGAVAGADLRTGRVAWQHRNGTVRDLAPVPMPFHMGVPNLGGPIVTAGGLAFLSGTLDYYVRAYDMANGRELWRARLPAGGQATPMTYQGNDGRQYVLVMAGGHGSLGTKAGDAVIAYALPK